MAERKGTKALELWCKRLVKDCPGINIDNMTTSWKNGLAFCALVHHFRPDLIDMSKLKPENVYENNQLAFNLAEKHLGIPSLLDPEDMVDNEIPDRLSILTYLSQFYQRLGHTANVKINENDNLSPTTSSMDLNMSSKFGKSALDKCVVCGLPVYLAQRLIVSQKLYHRRCYRCSQCAGHLDPNKFGDGNDFICATCKTDKPLREILNNNDVQMGMLAFHDEPETRELKKDLTQQSKYTSDKQNIRPKSIIEKINMFERNSDVDVVDCKFGKLSISNKIDTSKDNLQQFSSQNEKTVMNTLESSKLKDDKQVEHIEQHNEKDTIYRGDDKKNIFLQTQLCDDSSGCETKDKTKICVDSGIDLSDNFKQDTHNTNITDEVRLSKSALDNKCYNSNDSTDSDSNEVSITPRTSINESCVTESQDTVCETNMTPSKDVLNETCGKDLKEGSLTPEEDKSTISVPPRRKKIAAKINVIKNNRINDEANNESKKSDDYPEELNPFSDDDDEEDASKPTVVKTFSTNPFGSSEEEEDDVPEIPSVTKIQDNPAPNMRRLIKANNPFWSDGEEPSSDEEQSNNESSSMTTSTPNLAQSTPRRKKPAPPPPPLIQVSQPDHRMSSTEDLASISSVSSYNSTAFNDQRSSGKVTPSRSKKRASQTTGAPTDNVSIVSGNSRGLHGDSMELSLDSTGKEGRRVKGPAPGLPLPCRREVRLQVSAAELHTQLELLDAQQTGLERQGVLIEQMIRDKCEGDEATPVPQEEVEDLVIQLCELVNEKNDLFRKQTELMYIRRQQRLEQEQADIEHEIRVIQSRPAVNRIDADKAREEYLVSRLVEIVHLRDELVQNMDAERRREQQEDLAIATSIATKRAQRNDSNTSLKSADSTAPKKNKVKDKMKKQFKKAKHTLIPKKKDNKEHADKNLANKSNKE